MGKIFYIELKEQLLSTYYEKNKIKLFEKFATLNISVWPKKETAIGKKLLLHTLMQHLLMLLN